MSTTTTETTETIACIACTRLAMEHDADAEECVHEVDGRWYRLRCHASTPRHPVQWECLDLPRGWPISGTFGTATQAAAWSARSYATREDAKRAFPPAEKCREHRPVETDPVTGLPLDSGD